MSTVAPNNTFGRDPNHLTNADRLPNDRPHKGDPRRLSSQSLLDVRVSRAFGFGGRRVELLAHGARIRDAVLSLRARDERHRGRRCPQHISSPRKFHKKRWGNCSRFLRRARPGSRLFKRTWCRSGKRQRRRTLDGLDRRWRGGGRCRRSQRRSRRRSRPTSGNHRARTRLRGLRTPGRCGLPLGRAGLACRRRLLGRDSTSASDALLLRRCLTLPLGCRLFCHPVLPSTMPITLAASPTPWPLLPSPRSSCRRVIRRPRSRNTCLMRR